MMEVRVLLTRIMLCRVGCNGKKESDKKISFFSPNKRNEAQLFPNVFEHRIHAREENIFDGCRYYLEKT